LFRQRISYREASHNVSEAEVVFQNECH